MKLNAWSKGDTGGVSICDRLTLSSGLTEIQDPVGRRYSAVRHTLEDE